MKIQRTNTSYLLPVAGICIFIVLYFVSAALYPGGSEVDREAKGFSWRHNYWCDLLQPVAENGQPNKARSVAIIATAVLSISIALFWYFVPRLFTFKPVIKKLNRNTGILSMGILVFLQADSHDTIINIAGLSGIIAITGTLTGLYKRHSYGLFALGLICLLLFFVNNYIYYTKQFIVYLAVIQKLSFILFLHWFSLISIQLFQKDKAAASTSNH